MKNFLFTVKKVHLLFFAMAFALSGCDLEGLFGQDDSDYFDDLMPEHIEPDYEFIDSSEFEDEEYAEYAAKYVISGIDEIGSVELFGDGSFSILPPVNADAKAEVPLKNAAETRVSLGYYWENSFYCFGEYTSINKSVYHLHGLGTMTVADGIVSFELWDWQFIEPPHFSSSEGKYYIEPPLNANEFAKCLCRTWILSGVVNRGGYGDYDTDYYFMVNEFGYITRVVFSKNHFFKSDCNDGREENGGWDYPDIGKWELMDAGNTIRYYTGYEDEYEWVEAEAQFVKYKNKSGQYMRLVFKRVYLGDNYYVNYENNELVMIFKRK